MEPEQLAQQENLWIEESRNGNRQAFGRLVQLYMKTAYYSALSLVKNPDDALDLSQDAFLRAFRAMKRFKPGAKFYPWFHRILRNVCLTHLTKRGKRLDSVPLTQEDSEEWEFPDTKGIDPSEQLQERDLEQRIWDALQTLGPNDCEIIVLKDYKDFSYAEIAEDLDIPIGTVMSRLYNARSRLREKIQPFLESD